MKKKLCKQMKMLNHVFVFILLQAYEKVRKIIDMISDGKWLKSYDINDTSGLKRLSCGSKINKKKLKHIQTMSSKKNI